MNTSDTLTSKPTPTLPAHFNVPGNMSLMGSQSAASAFQKNVWQAFAGMHSSAPTEEQLLLAADYSGALNAVANVVMERSEGNGPHWANEAGGAQTKWELAQAAEYSTRLLEFCAQGSGSVGAVMARSVAAYSQTAKYERSLVPENL